TPPPTTALFTRSLHDALPIFRLRFFPHKLSHGSARFATMDELAATGLFKPGGVLLGRAHGRMVRYSGHGHLLTFAPTRSGKGVRSEEHTSELQSRENLVCRLL